MWRHVVRLIFLMFIRFPKTRLCKLSCIQIRSWVRRDGIRLGGWWNSLTSGCHVTRFQKSWETCLRQGIGIEKNDKKLNSSSDKASEVKLVGIQENEVYEQVSNFHLSCSCLTFGYHLFSKMLTTVTHTCFTKWGTITVFVIRKILLCLTSTFLYVSCLY